MHQLRKQCLELAEHRPRLVWSLLIGFAMIVALSIIGPVWYLIDLQKGLPDKAAIAQIGQMDQATAIYDDRDRLVFSIFKQQRIGTSLTGVSPHLIHAILAIEDQRFYDHGGLDFQGIARASLLMVQNYGSGKRPQGASTITQQVAKNFLLTNEASFERKIKEALLALKIERTYSKDKILELYLNEIYLGLGAYGIAAASLLYFDKSVHELNPAEAAYLAALPKGPNNYHPFRARERAIERRNYVIDRMIEDGYLKQADGEKSKKEPLAVTTRSRWRRSG